MDKQTTSTPITKQDWIFALKSLGVSGIVEVHTRLSAFSYVVGGARTIVDGLMEVLKDEGTILMPTQNSGNSEPSDWCKPPVPVETYQTIRENLPAFHMYESDLDHMGRVVENFRQRDGVISSMHPHMAYAAWGKYSKLLCNGQSLHFGLSQESPAARLYELKGNVLMIGTDYTTCTCMHLAEYMTNCRPVAIHGASVEDEQGKHWQKYLDLELDCEIFNKIGEILEKKKKIHTMELGGCTLKYFSAVDAVNEAVNYFEKTVAFELYR